MIDGKTVLSVIPARGGSKGLPKKNILPLAGKPLIGWSIEAAKKSKYIDKLIVSTDDVEIANVAKSYDCEVPFLRPNDFALDDSPSSEVIIHSIDFFEKMGLIFDYIVLLEPTSPLRETSDIDKAIEILHSNIDLADSIVGVSKVEATHPAFDLRINDKGLIEPYLGGSFSLFRRQEIESLYYFEGSLYISDTQVYLKEKNFYHDRTMPFILPRWKAIEIDEYIDMIVAEAIINNLDEIRNRTKNV